VLTVVVEEQEQKQLLIVQTTPGAELTHAILAQLQTVSVGRVASREPTLEDAYVQLVTLREPGSARVVWLGVLFHFKHLSRNAFA
jgi:hypothetical protein